MPKDDLLSMLKLTLTGLKLLRTFKNGQLRAWRSFYMFSCLTTDFGQLWLLADDHLAA